MNKKTKIILVLLCLVPVVHFSQGKILADDQENENSDLQIYLPREVTLEDKILTLGQIAIVTGSQSMIATANNIALGAFSIPGQEIVLERHVILSRLASNGISEDNVVLRGAEKIIVKQQEQIVTSEMFIKEAESFMEKYFEGTSVCAWNVIRAPKDFILPKTAEDVNFSTNMLQNSSRNQARVKITINSEDKAITNCEVVFGLQYECRQAVTLMDVPAGVLLNNENVKIETVVSNYPEPDGWKSPYGMVAKRALSADIVLRSNMYGSAEIPVVIKRNQNVVIRIEKPGFLITTVGQSMQNGKVGEQIKVKNIDSNRIILAIVSEDGTVEPVL